MKRVGSKIPSLLLFIVCLFLGFDLGGQVQANESVVFSLAQSASSGGDYEIQVATNGHTLYSSLIYITYEHSNVGVIDISTSINGLSLASNSNTQGIIQIALASASGVNGNATLATISFAGSAPDSISISSIRVNEGGTPSTIQVAQSTTLSGHVYFWGDASKPVSQVQVFMLQNGSQQTVTTQEDGSFSFTVEGAGVIQLTAVKMLDGRVAAGVDVSDIVTMRKHILARERLTDVLSLIGADPNRDASIDVSDIVDMRKLILARTNYYTKDASGQPESLWRFFDESVVNASDASGLFSVTDLETIVVDPASDDLTGLVLVGAKLGDCNGDW